MSKKVYIETPRLILRQWVAEDYPLMVAMNQDKAVMRYFPDLLNEVETKALIRTAYQEIEDKGYGAWAVERIEDKQFIGFVGLHKASFPAHFTPCIEIAWRLRKEFWHMGYATEAAKACLEYGFETLKLDKIYSFTAIINTPSQAVMKRIGMQEIGLFSHPNVEEHSPLQEHVLYVKHARG